MKRRITYANVVSTLALVLALGTGGAYAVDKIGSSDVLNDSLRSDDLKDGAGVKAKDVRKDALTGKQVRESTLAASGFSSLTGTESSSCEPVGSTFEDCLTKRVRIKQRGRVLGIATGGQLSPASGAPGSAKCQIQVDGVETPSSSNPGEVSVNTDVTGTNGFARTVVSPVLDPGEHEVALVCSRQGSNLVRISGPTLAVIAIGSR